MGPTPRARFPRRRTVPRRPAQLARPGEYGVEHGLGELAGEGVLLTDVIAADEPVRARASRPAPGGHPEGRLGSVTESWSPAVAHRPPGDIPRELAEGDDDAHGPQQLQFG